MPLHFRKIRNDHLVSPHRNTRLRQASERTSINRRRTTRPESVTPWITPWRRGAKFARLMYDPLAGDGCLNWQIWYIFFRGWTMEDGMTITQAAELRVKWKQRVNPIPCEHLNLELELSGSGSTGKYNCIVCGEPILHQHQ